MVSLSEQISASQNSAQQEELREVKQIHYVDSLF